MTSKVLYEGNLRTVATHLASSNSIVTDAPIDNHGRGEAFSPTDLVATALGSCMLTVMGIKANDLAVDLVGAVVYITKIMGTEPRRIIEIKVRFELKGKIVSDKDRTILERIARTCPVLESLHPDLKKDVAFTWE
jgi:putative redox protein